MLGTLLLCFAVCFGVFATIGIPGDLGRWKWIAASLLFLELALLFGPIATIPSLLR